MYFRNLYCKSQLERPSRDRTASLAQYGQVEQPLLTGSFSICLFISGSPYQGELDRLGLLPRLPMLLNFSRSILKQSPSISESWLSPILFKQQQHRLLSIVPGTTGRHWDRAGIAYSVPRTAQLLSETIALHMCGSN